MFDAYDFVSKNGIVHDTDYKRYSARKGACDVDNSKEKFFNTNQMEEDDISNDRLKELLAR